MLSKTFRGIGQAFQRRQTFASIFQLVSQVILSFAVIFSPPMSNVIRKEKMRFFLVFNKRISYIILLWHKARNAAAAKKRFCNE